MKPSLGHVKPSYLLDDSGNGNGLSEALKFRWNLLEVCPMKTLNGPLFTFLRALVGGAQPIGVRYDMYGAQVAETTAPCESSSRTERRSADRFMARAAGNFRAPWNG